MQVCTIVLLQGSWLATALSYASSIDPEAAVILRRVAQRPTTFYLRAYGDAPRGLGLLWPFRLLRLL